MEDEAGKSRSGPGAWGFGAFLGLMIGTFVYIPVANLLLRTFGLSTRPDEPVTSFSIMHWLAWIGALLLILLPGVVMVLVHRFRRAGIGYLGMALVIGGIAAYAMISGISPTTT